MTGVVVGVGDAVTGTVLSGSMLLALPLAVLAGLVSFASPCVLPLIPGYLGYVTGMAGAAREAAATPVAPAGVAGEGPGGATAVAARPRLADVGRGRMLAGVALFIGGFTLVFVAFGVLAGSLGAALAQGQDVVTRVLGVVVVVMGLVFTGWLPIAQRERRIHLAPTAGLWGAPLLGVVFGLGWAPCIGPTLVAIYTLALDEASAGRGALLSVAYCLGLGLPFVLIALFFQRSARALAVLRRHRVAIMRTGGLVLVVVGLALVTGVWGTWTGSLQGLVSGFETAL